jgi:acylglycerol lipase
MHSSLKAKARVLRPAKLIGLRAAGLILITGMLASCTPSYFPMEEQTTEPRIDGDVFIARDGTALSLTVWGPRKEPKKIVIAAHSFGDFRAAFALIGEHLASQDIAVWAYDQRGFGDGPHRGLWSDKETLVQDFQDFIVAVRTVAGKEQPFYLLGESMGAAVVIAALATNEMPLPDAVILSGPGVRENRPRRYWYNVGLWILTHIWPSYEASVDRPYDVRLAETHAKRWSEDPRIINQVRMDTYFGLIQLSDLASDTASSVKVPTLVLFGSEDTQIHPKSLCALMDRLDSNGTLKLFQGKPHLMFQVKEQYIVLPLISRWLENLGVGLKSDQSSFCAV